jgi:hypothetical protein
MLEIVKQILLYGFWIAVLIIVAGLGYGGLTFALSEAHKDVSILTTKTPHLELVDSYVDNDSLLNIKMVNHGNGDAFIYETRLVHYFPAERPIVAMTVCSAIIANQISDPIVISRDNSQITVDKRGSSAIPDYVTKIFDTIVTKNPGDLPKQLYLSNPLKVAAQVPSGGVEWLKLQLVYKTTKNSGACRLMITEMVFANAVVYYNSGNYIITPTLTFSLGE